jgi:hypothetical protein
MRRCESTFPPSRLLAEKSNEMRAFKLHELVNKLPEPKKASLKSLFGLLSEVAKEHEVNRVSDAIFVL